MVTSPTGSDYVWVGRDRHEDVYFTIHRGEPGTEGEHFFVCIEQEVGLRKNFEDDGRRATCSLSSGRGTVLHYQTQKQI